MSFLRYYLGYVKLYLTLKITKVNLIKNGDIYKEFKNKKLLFYS